ncbi:probable serine/threonine-protein kinase DDB_G0283337 [Microplitis mediator]|uniref:probable serine/threonine-protein kinase DDB_G0283337 n=1 Tax=Microplitis mediator TaxID=375433 RepID=UPI0025534BC9|nr:probable serine/threonine-protein kinase DDB_G0283337 [Microplitis mediator]
MQVNWANWRQPNGNTCNYNYNFPSQSLHSHCNCIAVGYPNLTSTWLAQLFKVQQNIIANYQVHFNHGLIGSSSSSSPSPSQQNNPRTRVNSPLINQTNFKNTSNEPEPVIIQEIPSKITSDKNNQTETMDPKKFVVETRFNAFAVNFKNVNGISEDQVREIFSVYGKIKRIAQTGDNYGLCFVNYENEDDAVQSVLGVKNHPDIRLREARFTTDRSKKQTDNSSFSNFNGNNGNSNTSNGFNTNTYNNYSNESASKSIEPIVDEKLSKSDEWPTETKIEQESVVLSRDNDPSKNEQRNIPMSYDTQPLPAATESSETSNNLEKVTEEDQRSNASAKSQVQIPELVAKISKLSKGSSSSLENESTFPKMPIEKMAQEILVANIEEGVNIHAILQLLEKYQPFAATDIQKYVPSNLRYCYVYFTSQQRAQAVESEFNNCVLMDKKLLVVRANNLVNVYA